MFDEDQKFRRIWNAVRIERAMPYQLFTFGQTDLPYTLVMGAKRQGEPVAVIRGEVSITRPLILTPDNLDPEFRGFFGEEDREFLPYLMARGMSVPHLRFDNRSGSKDLVSDSVEEVVAGLLRRLDELEEDRMAVLSAPHGYGGLSLMKYAIEKAMESAPGNLQELRERGLLPDGL